MLSVALQLVHHENFRAAGTDDIDQHGAEGKEVKVEALVKYLSAGVSNEPSFVAERPCVPIEFLVHDERLPLAFRHFFHGAVLTCIQIDVVDSGNNPETDVQIETLPDDALSSYYKNAKHFSHKGRHKLHKTD